MDNFNTLALRSELKASLQRHGYTKPSEIQARSLPLSLEGKDLVACAATGSGKTLAFALALLNELEPVSSNPTRLILTPTRELAEQIAKTIRQLAQTIPNVKVLTIYGATAVGYQRRSLEHGVDILIATPGRLMDLDRKGYLSLKEISQVVIDEADCMLDMGFFDDISFILDGLPQDRQTLMFSATFDGQARQLAESFMREPSLVEVAKNEAHADISHRFIKVSSKNRDQALANVLLSEWQGPSLVFVNTQAECARLEAMLNESGFKAISIHGGMEQEARHQAWALFQAECVHVLLATDVAARGLDIKGLPLVIQYELNRSSEVYVHRSGRTGRADTKGLALSFINPERESKNLSNALKAASLPTNVKFEQVPRVSRSTLPELKYQLIKLDLGKKSKIRKGDILGALTREKVIDGKDVGVISIHVFFSFVAIRGNKVKQALNLLNNNPVKKRTVKARIVF